jgi:hypothetical protein
MRLISIIVISAVFGTAFGAALAYFDVRPKVGSELPATESTQAEKAPPVDRSAPRVEVDSTSYQFGTMQRGTTMSHEFMFHNVGAAPLTLEVLSTSCKCTIGDVTGEPIAPGTSVGVKLEWHALVAPGPFRQTARIKTNDPRESLVTLTVEGDVTEASGVWPPDFVFDKVGAGKEASAEVYVMALTQDNLEVNDPTLSNPSTRELFDIQIESVEPESLPNPKAKGGVRIRLTAKPGLPLGHFDQYLSLTTDIPDATRLDIPVIGRVVGNVSVHGRLWSEPRGSLMLGNVRSDQGASAELNLVIRGKGADDVKMEVISTDPPEMIAKLDEPTALRPTLVHVPLTVEIPAGTRPMVRLDTDHSDGGRITLKTTHPDAPELVLRVQFTVER